MERLAAGGAGCEPANGPDLGTFQTDYASSILVARSERLRPRSDGISANLGRYHLRAFSILRAISGPSACRRRLSSARAILQMTSLDLDEDQRVQTLVDVPALAHLLAECFHGDSGQRYDPDGRCRLGRANLDPADEDGELAGHRTIQVSRSTSRRGSSAGSPHRRLENASTMTSAEKGTCLEVCE